MIHYLDASCCVAALTPETGTERVAAWLEANRERPLAISSWVHVEVASALSIKVRTGSLAAGDRASVIAAWLGFRKGLRLLDIGDPHFEAAAEMLARHDLGLRAGDALHLAVAAAYGCTLATLDARLAKAAPELGVRVAEI